MLADDELQQVDSLQRVTTGGANLGRALYDLVDSAARCIELEYNAGYEKYTYAGVTPSFSVFLRISIWSKSIPLLATKRSTEGVSSHRPHSQQTNSRKVSQKFTTSLVTLRNLPIDLCWNAVAWLFTFTNAFRTS